MYTKQILKKFDLYPFVTLATNADGNIVYKNIITKSIYPHIHVGAKLSVYTDIDTSASGIIRVSFYGEDTTVFLYKLESDTVQNIITVFSPACAHLILSMDSDSEYDDAIRELIEKEESHDNYKQKHALIRHIGKSQDISKTCGNFSRLYFENCDYDKSECVSIVSFFQSLSNIMEKRLALGIKFDIESSDSGASICMDKQCVMTLLNLICFSLSVSEDRDLSVSFNENQDRVRISIKSNCSFDISKIFDVENGFPYIFTLLVGINFAEHSEYAYAFSHEGKTSVFEITVPLKKASEASFSSSGVSELFINEYFTLFKSIFKN